MIGLTSSKYCVQKYILFFTWSGINHKLNQPCPVSTPQGLLYMYLISGTYFNLQMYKPVFHLPLINIIKHQHLWYPF